METYLLALILGLLALIIRYAIKGCLEGFASNKQSTASGDASDSGNLAIITHQNTAGIKHTDNLIQTAKDKIKSAIANVSKSIDAMSKKVEKNTTNIAKNTDNDKKMAAAVTPPKKKK